MSEANALLGCWYGEDADYGQATRYYRESLNIDLESDDDLGEARAMRRLARVARKRGDHAQAADYLRKSSRASSWKRRRYRTSGADD